jgi:hypothetical protein
MQKGGTQMIRKGFPLLAVFLLLIPGISRGDLVHGFEAGITNAGWPRLSETFPVPEASALTLLGTGLVGLVVWRRRKRFE